MKIVDPLRAAYERYYDGLFRVALLVTGSREEAEDVVQESFLKAAPRLASLPADQVLAYLRTTVMNEWRSRARRVRRLRARLPLIASPDVIDAPASEVREDLWASVLRLPQRQRACVVLRFYEDLSMQQIADVLGCSVGTVKSQLHRALAHVRKDQADAHRG